MTQPRLSWVLTTADPNARDLSQTAYRVLVASSPQNLTAGKGDLWDTGKVSSDRSIQIAHAGKPLTSSARAFWKAMVWDQNGQASAWSQPARWFMGLLSQDDWKALWIGRDEPTLYKDPASPYRHLAKAK